MSFDFMGRPAKNLPRQGIWSTWGMVITILCFWVFLNIVVLLGLFVKLSTNVGVEPGDVAALVVVNVAMLAYVVYAAAATRGSIREKYLIREYKFIDLEDCLCATFCLPCTICQMGRHTASFGDHEGVCWNDTGLPDGVSSVVV
jgi:Cys-rich protein (TIGR01571 family)